MKALIEARWDTFRTSYWFVPALLSAAAMACAGGMLLLDERGVSSINKWWVYRGGAEGARLLVSTIVGSIITVVSVVFSVTMVTLTLASSQFGPRLLQSFMRDTMNQIVLGAFIATFIYHLLILGSISNANGEEFVPYRSVTAGVVMVFVCVGLLIFFIHNVSTSIQADKVIAKIHRELDGAIDRLFPNEIGRDPNDGSGKASRQFVAVSAADAEVILAAGDRYLQGIENETLLDLAVEYDKVIETLYRPGEFVIKGTPMMQIWPRDHLDEKLKHALQSTIVFGEKRTATQDAEYAIDQLVEIAVRALPPGINDPFTAIACIDHLSAALCRLATKQFASVYRFDKEGHLRIKAKATDFCGYFDAAFTQIRQDSAESPAVLIHLLEAVNQVATFADEQAQQQCIDRHRKMIIDLGLQAFKSEDDREDLLRRIEKDKDQE